MDQALAFVQALADRPGGHAGCYFVRLHVRGDDSAGGYDGTATDGHAAQDYGSVADPYVGAYDDRVTQRVWMVADPSRRPYGAANVPDIVVVPSDHADVVREHRSGADRTVYLQSDALADVDVVADRQKARRP